MRASTLVSVAVCAALVVVTAWLGWSQRTLRLNTPVPEPISSFLPIQIAGVLVWSAAAVVMLRRPEIGWSSLASLAALSHALVAAGYTWAVRGLVLGAAAPGAGTAAWLTTWLLPVEVAVANWMMVTVPDGRLPRGRLRLVALLGVALPTMGVLANAAAQLDLTGTDFAAAQTPGGGLPIPLVVVPALIAPSALLTFAVCVLRWRASRGLERLAMRRVVVLTVTGLAIPPLFVLGPDVAVTAAQVLTSLQLLALIAVVTRNRLVGIEPALDRALKLTLLSASLFGGYVALVALGDAVFARSVGPFAAVTVALLALPAHRWLGGLTRRFVYGDRDEPARVVDAVLREAGTAAEPGQLLDAIVRRLYDGLRLPWVAVLEPVGEGVLAVHGERRTDGPTTIDLVHRGDVVGVLETGPRSGEASLGPADHRALQQIATSVALVVDTVQSARALRISRDRLVHVREEERRRLRRDLHDGLGPILTAVALTTDAASNLLVEDASAARGLLGTARGELTGAISEIRRLVEDLRPPALDDLGLLGALRQHAQRFPSLVVRVQSAAALGELPAAVEVAAYRVATEALTNAARHGAAHTVEVRLQRSAASPRRCLEVEIIDDGDAASPWKPGVGLRSMAERVAETGGHLETGPQPTGGGRVWATFPLDR